MPLKLARAMQMPPLEIAERLVPLIPLGGALAQVEVARPGFINFTLDAGWLRRQVDAILEAGERYGATETGVGQRVQVEFVSVNPTGPLHVGHARGAVIGSALANVLAAAGFDVVREYYFNDSGSQMDRFYQSLYARYAQGFGREAELPPDGYAGQYLVDLADTFRTSDGDRFLHLDQEQATSELGKLGIARMMQTIREDVQLLRVDFDVWFSEASLYEHGQFDRAMALLRELGFVVERDGAVWFASTTLGEEQDKVLIRRTGAPTYFATDVAYHYNKFIERKFDVVINVLGADHHGHVAQMHSLVKALGVPAEKLSTIVHQMVTLKRQDEMVRASKRTGAVVTLRELVDEVGADACRYFFLARSPDAHMEFDLDLAASQSQENPVYYIQYAHARIAGILRQAQEQGLSTEEASVQALTEPEEVTLIRRMVALPELVDSMARAQEPHHLAHYALDLATAFHVFYDRQPRGHRRLGPDRGEAEAGEGGEGGAGPLPGPDGDDRPGAHVGGLDGRLRPVFPALLHVVLQHRLDELDVALLQPPADPPRRARDHRVRGDHRALQHHGAAPDDAVVADVAAVDDRPAADEDELADAVGVAEDVVADGRVGADPAIPVRVHRAVVLDAGVLPDDDAAHIAAHHRARPDAGVGVHLHVADDVGKLADVGVGVNPGPHSLEGSQHGASLRRGCASIGRRRTVV